MSDPNFVLLYINDAGKSAAFYETLLGKPPVDAAPTFAMFALENGMKLGLWSRNGVEPQAGPVGGGELAFAVANDEVVNRHHSEWSARGLTILQAPTSMDFGFTFTAADPDGHRLRVFAPAA